MKTKLKKQRKREIIAGTVFSVIGLFLIVLSLNIIAFLGILMLYGGLIYLLKNEIL